jgi:hypothetical protein
MCPKVTKRDVLVQIPVQLARLKADEVIKHDSQLHGSTTMATTEHPAVPEGYKLKKKKPIFKRVWFWLLVILVVIIIAAVSGGGGGDSSTSTSGSASTESASNDGGAAAAPAASKTDVAAGETVNLDDVQVTSTPLTPVQPQYSNSSYLCTTVTYVNGGKDSASFNTFVWKLQDPQGASRDATFGGSDKTLNSGDLAPAGTVSGDVCFDDPTGASGTYKVIYSASFWNDTKATWSNQR